MLPGNARLGKDGTWVQLTLPEIRGIHLGGPGEVKVKLWPRVQNGRISARLCRLASSNMNVPAVALTEKIL